VRLHRTARCSIIPISSFPFFTSRCPTRRTPITYTFTRTTFFQNLVLRRVLQVLEERPEERVFLFGGAQLGKLVLVLDGHASRVHLTLTEVVLAALRARLVSVPSLLPLVDRVLPHQLLGLARHGVVIIATAQSQTRRPRPPLRRQHIFSNHPLDLPELAHQGLPVFDVCGQVVEVVELLGPAHLQRRALPRRHVCCMYDDI